MDQTPLTLLNLCTPLQYIKSACQDPLLLKYEKLENDEILLCYEVDSVQGSSIEPDRDYLLGKLLFIGQNCLRLKMRVQRRQRGITLFRFRRGITCLCNAVLKRF